MGMNNFSWRIWRWNLISWSFTFSRPFELPEALGLPILLFRNMQRALVWVTKVTWELAPLCKTFKKIRQGPAGFSIPQWLLLPNSEWLAGVVSEFTEAATTKMLQTGWLTHNRNIFLTVLGPEAPRSRGQRDHVLVISFWWESPFWFRAGTYSCVLTWWRGPQLSLELLW